MIEVRLRAATTVLSMLRIKEESVCAEIFVGRSPGSSNADRMIRLYRRLAFTYFLFRTLER